MLEVCGTDNLHTCPTVNIPFLPMLEVRGADNLHTSPTFHCCPTVIASTAAIQKEVVLQASLFPTRILHCGLCFLWTAYLSLCFQQESCTVGCVSCRQPTYLCVSDKNLALWVVFLVNLSLCFQQESCTVGCVPCGQPPYLCVCFVLFVCFLWTTYLSLCFQQEFCTVGCVSCGQAISVFLCVCFYFFNFL